MARILYIEDNQSVRESTEVLLKREGHSVISREDTAKADDIVNQWRPHLVITDHELGAGKETGLERAMRLKDAGVKVCMLSGCAVARDKASTAFIRFFIKPYHIPALLLEMNIDEDEAGSSQMVLPHTNGRKGGSV